MSLLSGLDDAAWTSPWRHVPVPEKVLVSGALVVTALVLPPVGSVLVIVACAVLLAVARIRITLVLGAVAAPAGFIVLSALTTVVSLGPPPPGAIWSWGWGSVTPGALEAAVALALRAVSATLAVFVLAMTTPMADLISWLRRLRIPGAVLDVAGLIYRMIFGAWNSLVAVRAAQIARLGDKGGVVRRIRLAASGLGSVSLRTWSQAERLSAGLAGRGYDGTLTTLPRGSSRTAWPVCLAAVAGVWIGWGVVVWSPWR